MRIQALLAQKKSTEVIAVRPESTLLDTANVLREHNIGALLVTDGQEKLEGVVSERDLVRAMTEFRDTVLQRPVSDIMTRSVISCSPNDKIVDIMAIMNAKNIRHIPVQEGEKLTAMLSIRDFDHAYKRLREQSLTDELTGVSNRRHFLEILDQEFNRYRRFQTPLSVAVVDIDDFKETNEKYGQSTGDQMLSKLAELLNKDLRTFDGLGRIGGEKFAIAFPSTEMEKTRRACERLLLAIRSIGIAAGQETIHFTASFGVTEAHSETRDINDIMGEAEQNLVEAKSKGKNQVVAAAGNAQSGQDQSARENHGDRSSAAA